jgi:head-tail adaptor
MLPSGVYHQRVRFERRATAAADDLGVTEGGWVSVLTVPAAFRPRFGREVVEAGRLEASFGGTLTIRSSRRARLIDAAHKVVFLRAPYEGREANIRQVVPTPDGGEIEMVVEEGVAT